MTLNAAASFPDMSARLQQHHQWPLQPQTACPGSPYWHQKLECNLFLIGPLACLTPACYPCKDAQTRHHSTATAAGASQGQLDWRGLLTNMLLLLAANARVLQAIDGHGILSMCYTSTGRKCRDGYRASIAQALVHAPVLVLGLRSASSLCCGRANRAVHDVPAVLWGFLTRC